MINYTHHAKELKYVWLLRVINLNVLSQLPVTKRFISGIHARSLTGASCMPTVVGWPPDNSGHILTCLSHPPEKTVVPSSFHAEHKTWKQSYKVTNKEQNIFHNSQGITQNEYYRLLMWHWCLRNSADSCSWFSYLPTSYLRNHNALSQLFPPPPEKTTRKVIRNRKLHIPSICNSMNFKLV